MKKKFMDSYVSSCSEVLMEFLDEQPVVGPIESHDKALQTMGIVIHVGITGDLSGRFILDISPETALKMASVYLSEELKETDNDLINSAMAEVMNILTGRAISIMNELSLQVNITPPTIYCGAGMSIYDKNSQTLSCMIDTEKVGKFYLNLYLKDV